MKRQKARKIVILCSFMLFPLIKPFFSPVTVVMGILQGVVTGGLAIYILLFVQSLFFGRLFCGWFCPGGGLQECCAFIVPKKPATGKLNRIKYFFWAPFVAVLIATAIAAGGFHSIDLLFQQKLNIPEFTEYVVYYAGIVLILVLALIFGKRAECHYTCWLSPFMVVGDKLGRLLKLPSVYLRVNADACTRCRRCDGKCMMSLPVSQMVKDGGIKDSECILCGECVDTCPQKAIQYGFGVRRPAGKQIPAANDKAV